MLNFLTFASAKEDAMRYFVSLSFRGAKYCGWQIQKNGPSIQEELERALATLLTVPTAVTGAGRTDAGVNAENFIAHFDSDGDSLLIRDPAEFIYKFNAILPGDIVINDIFRVKDDAHARFDAVSRTYRYYVHTVKDPFRTDFSYPFYRNLDITVMNEAAGHLLGTKDFSTFEKLHGGNATSICTVTGAEWNTMEDNEHLAFTVTANRFLRNMVRAIVGTLLEVGCGKRTPASVTELIDRHDRCAAGQSVAGNALFLTQIDYPYELKTIL